jgi:serine phosphatase RsbU (regulator of sigma subunit)
VKSTAQRNLIHQLEEDNSYIQRRFEEEKILNTSTEDSLRLAETTLIERQKLIGTLETSLKTEQATVERASNNISEHAKAEHQLRLDVQSMEKDMAYIKDTTDRLLHETKDQLRVANESYAQKEAEVDQLRDEKAAQSERISELEIKVLI